MDALQEAFVIEARELIAQLEDGLMALEKAPDDELLHAVFAAHTPSRARLQPPIAP